MHVLIFSFFLVSCYFEFQTTFTLSLRFLYSFLCIYIILTFLCECSHNIYRCRACFGVFFSCLMFCQRCKHCWSLNANQHIKKFNVTNRKWVKKIAVYGQCYYTNTQSIAHIKLDVLTVALCIVYRFCICICWVGAIQKLRKERPRCMIRWFLYRVHIFGG